MRPTAVVMNMFYTGLGIARSLGERGVPVVGLTSQRGIYGNYTRYARIVFSPDSRTEPEALLEKLLQLGKDLGHRAVIFPTRDDDVVFLDRYRGQLNPYFILTVPERPIIEACLNKWETFLWAERTKVPTPKCWLIENEANLQDILSSLAYPCVLKPVAAHHWRKDGNWQLVGGRKAIGVSSEAELLIEYRAISQADPRVLVQELIPGSDECLLIAACYFDRQSKFVAGFNTQKVVQIPEGFGTGCIVQAANCPELFAPTIRLLQEMRYTGIAEVEYKWHAGKKEYQLIEINPRPWDQHTIGRACGTDVIYLSYCDHAGLPMPQVEPRPSTAKWVAEDAFFMAALRLLWKRDPELFRLFRLARGRRIYAIGSWRDPLPSLIYLTTRFIPSLIVSFARHLWSKLFVKRQRGNKSLVYER